MIRTCSIVVVLAVGFLAAAQERPAAAKSAARLIEELDDPRFRVRDQAFQELVRLGDAAVPALAAALKKPSSTEQRDRIYVLLARRRPSEFDADFNGWHWAYGWIANAQTFEATGATIKSLRLRVAQLNGNRPAAPLQVEIRDLKFETIYALGTIDPAVLERDFRWQNVAFKHVAPLKFGESYALVFHSRGSTNTALWVVNTIYRDIYPHGYQWHAKHQDIFFHIEYHEGTSLRVGPKGDDVTIKTPINSGAVGGNINDGPLALQDFGVLPAGKLKE